MQRLPRDPIAGVWDEAWANDIYQCFVLYDNPTRSRADVVHLSIKTHEREAVHDWRHFQWIKNDVMGPEREAVELYPAESRLVDGANQFHLWVMPEGVIIPFGFTERVVTGEAAAAAVGAVQRPWPADRQPRIDSRQQTRRNTRLIQKMQRRLP